MNDSASASTPALPGAPGSRRPRRFSFQLTIAAVFGAFLSVSIASVVWFDYASNSRSALEAADALLDEVGDKIFEAVRNEFEPVVAIVDLAANLPGIERHPEPADHPLRPILGRAVAANPQVESLGIGFDNGDFFQVVAYGDDDEMRRTARRAPDRARLEIRAMLPNETGARREYRTYFDGKGEQVGQKEMTPSFDPRTRPWYHAVDTGRPAAWTELFVFGSSEHIGFTYARRFPGGVLGANLRLDQISGFLASQRFGADSRLLIFDREGRVFAHPDPSKVVKEVAGFRGSVVEPATVDDLQDPALSEIFRLFLAAGAAQATKDYEFRANGRDYIGKVTPLPAATGPGGFLALAVPVDEIVGPIARSRDRSLMFAGVLALGAVGFVFWVSRRISRPLRVLAAEIRKLRELHLAGRIDVSSRVAEIAELADGLAGMKTALRTFGQYVPRDLVRQFVQSGIEPAIGGEKRELTVLFTDVKDFTKLADSIPPEELMTRTARYFDRLTTPIVGRAGVIDKYIGDAVMAFWNAPNPDADHALNACMAALEARAAIAVFNEELVAKGHPPMRTRFGIHTGEVVVGNLGTRERMDYTAVGGNVNLASRLEGLNSHYGTEILVSEAVLPLVFGKFGFRPVDVVIPKGKSEPVAIYELVGGIRGAVELNARLLVSAEEEDRCARHWDAYLAYRNREWERAIALYSLLRGEDPADPIAPLYIERATRHQAEPPPDDWMGAEKYETK